MIRAADNRSLSAPGDRSVNSGAAPRSQGIKTGLARRVFSYTFPVISVIVLATQLGLGFLNYKGHLANHAARAELTARLIAAPLAKAVWNMDQAMYASQLRAVAHDDSFRWAALWDEKGTPLFMLGQLPDRHLVRVDKPLIAPGGSGVIGRFSLAMSTESVARNAIQQAVVGLSAILIMLGGFFLTLHLTVRRLVKHPLDRLLAAMAQVERKDWQKVDWQSSDEIGRVTEAFNRMVDGLKSGDEAKRLLAELEQAQQAILVKNSELKKANQLILDSIHYARRIQTAILPDPAALNGSIKDLHVCWEPIQMVGGDYFWLERFGGQSLLVVIDCTGHGVSGAFMTLVTASALDKILREKGLLKPSEILTELDRLVRARLRQDQPDSSSDDGLEAGICVWDPRKRSITFAGAGIPLLYSRNGEIVQIRGNRDCLGYRTLPPRGDFIDHVVPVKPGMDFYLLTDGAPDHMGGQPPRLLGRKRLAAMIQPLVGQPMIEQLRQIQQQLKDYRGDEPRRDDMTLVGFRPL